MMPQTKHWYKFVLALIMVELWKVMLLLWPLLSHSQNDFSSY